MDFIDEGVIISARPHGEAHAVVELFTAAHGRWAGLVFGGQGRRMQSVLQIGNGVAAQWKARTEDQLGHYSLELTKARAALALDDRLALAGLSAAAAVTRAALPEREAHAGLYAAFVVLLQTITETAHWPALYARYELGLLSEMGYGLSLDRCAATGTAENLIYVSPRSAAAVSREAGAPYHSRMLPLPAFLRDSAADWSAEDVVEALRTTGYFIETRLIKATHARMPEARARLVELLVSAATTGAPADATPFHP